MSSEDFDMNDSTWMSADPHLASSLSPSQDERMRSPQNLHSQEDGECPLVAGGGEAVQDNRAQESGVVESGPEPLGVAQAYSCPHSVLSISVGPTSQVLVPGRPSRSSQR